MKKLNNDLNSLLFHEKAVGLFLLIDNKKTRNIMIKESKTCYSHGLRLLEKFENLNLIEIKNKNYKLTDIGKKIKNEYDKQYLCNVLFLTIIKNNGKSKNKPVNFEAMAKTELRSVKKK